MGVGDSKYEGGAIGAPCRRGSLGRICRNCPTHRASLAVSSASVFVRSVSKPLSVWSGTIEAYRPTGCRSPAGSPDSPASQEARAGQVRAPSGIHATQVTLL